jgi:hypothetical protein
MRKAWLYSAATAALILAGCTSTDENPHWSPGEEYPDWAYNAPFYQQPTVELEPLETVGNQIPIYYTREDLFFVKHPLGEQANQTPQLAIYASADGGQNWVKGGYFGLEQTHFLYKAETDGRYWIRFVGPDQGTSDVPPGQPHRIYVVDTVAPQFNISITPNPWIDEKRTIPRMYHVGQEITIEWTAFDPYLVKESVQLSTAYARFPHNLVWSEFPDKLPPIGRMRVVIPPEAKSEAGIRFRMIAKDKAGNIGIGMGPILAVVDSPADVSPPAPAPAKAETGTPDDLLTPPEKEAEKDSPDTKTGQALETRAPAAAPAAKPAPLPRRPIDAAPTGS